MYKAKYLKYKQKYLQATAAPLASSTRSVGLPRGQTYRYPRESKTGDVINLYHNNNAAHTRLECMITEYDEKKQLYKCAKLSGERKHGGRKLGRGERVDDRTVSKMYNTIGIENVQHNIGQ